MPKSCSSGTHIILLYETESDLIRIFAPFFAAGLKNNEFCIGIYPNRHVKQKLIDGLSKLVNIKQFINQNQIQFIYYKDFYFKKDMFSKVKVYSFIDKKLNSARFEGLDGIRGAGDMSWVRNAFFKKVLVYEKGLTKKYRKSPIIVMCAYPVKKLAIHDLIDMIQSHTLILYKKGRKFCLSETTERRILIEERDGLEKFNKVAVDRELKMIELKEKIAELEKKIGIKH